MAFVYWYTKLAFCRHSRYHRYMSEAKNRRRQTANRLKNRRRSRKPRNKRRNIPRDESSLGKLRRQFLGCGRCSFFLTGYQAAESITHLTTLAEQEGDWMQLNWTTQTRDLLFKTVGRTMEKNVSYYSVCCPECLRLYEVTLPESEGEVEFRVQRTATLTK